MFVFAAYVGIASACQWPSPQYDALEALLYEGRRDDVASVGAEWLRLAYHDAMTYNASDGTRGLDASIIFELNRENVGAGMSASLLDFESFPNKYVSRSDIIALAATFVVASCGGPIIPYRGGRVDPLHAGPPGMCRHTSIFARVGFTQDDMIALVACGHTLGSVRSADFPSIVPVRSGTSDVSFRDFDTSKTYDNSIVLQYLNGPTLDPLVIAANETMRSDLRIFSSDGNVTMRKLESPDVFNQTCSALLERMLNTVPLDVTLTDEIQPLHAKVTRAHLTLEHDQLIFKSSFRDQTVNILWCSRYGDLCANGYIKPASASSESQDAPDISPVTQRLGYYFMNYQFVIPHDGEQPTIYDNNGQGYAVDQDNTLYVPMLSTVTFSGPECSIKNFHLVAAVRDSINLSRVYMSVYDGAIPVFNPPLDRVITLALNHTIRPVEGFVFYSGSVEDTELQLTVDMHCTQDFMQTFFLDISVPFTPPTTVQVTPAQLPGTATTSSLSSISSSAQRTFMHQSDFSLILLSSLYYKSCII
ncbi:heme peroxidase [Cyathus striatus]|nr:heme peroxidase [Cyathus striatus]